MGWPIYHHVPRSLQLYMAHALEWRFVKGPSNQIGTLPCIFAEGVPIMQQIMIFMTHKHSWSPGCCSETHDVERTLENNKIQLWRLPQPRQQQHQQPPTNKQTQYQQIDMEPNIHIIHIFICISDSMRIVWSCFLRVQNHSIYLVITSHYHHIDLHETRWCQVGMFQRWRLRGGELGWVSLGGGRFSAGGRLKSSGSSLRYG